MSSHASRALTALLISASLAGPAHAAPARAYTTALDTASIELGRQASRAGLSLDLPKTTALLRGDYVAVVAPVSGLRQVTLADLTTPGANTLIAGAYLCAPCNRVVRPPGAGGSIPAYFFGLAVQPNGTVDPATGLPGLDLFLTLPSGAQYPMGSGGLIWADDTAPPDASKTLVDLSVNADEFYDPASHSINWRIWVQSEKWRACWGGTVYL